MQVCFDLNHYDFKFTTSNAQVLEDANRILLFAGLIRQEQSQLLWKADTPQEWQQAFMGPFVLLVFFKQQRCLTVTQHALGGTGTRLYMHEAGNLWYLATSLSELRQAIGRPFHLNTEQIPTFIYNSFFPDGQTLIAQIRTLKNGFSLKIDAHGIREERLTFEWCSAPTTQSKSEQYREALDISIRECTADLRGPLHFALSGGYDSNCILYHLHKQRPDTALHAYSVGGAQGVNESATAAEIVKYYAGTDLEVALVTEQTLSHLDEIVYALEGAVFERGIFLQYELARLLRERQVKQVICGEAADQVFREDTYELIGRPAAHYSVYGTPLEAAGGLIIPKSQLMLRAFGIESRYPYIHPMVVKLGYNTRHENARHKDFHKAMLKELLRPEVYALLHKIGGSTDLSPLFPEDFSCSQFMKKCRYYSTDTDPEQLYAGQKFPADMNNMEEACRKYYLQLKFIESFERQFCGI